MINRSFLPLFALLLSLMASISYGAVNSQQIRNSIDNYMPEHLELIAQQYGNNTRTDYRIGSLDARISMADCPIPLNVEQKSNNNIGNINLKISCDQQAIWSIYVPIQVSLYRPVVTAASPITRGLTITPSHLQLREMDISKLNGSYFTSIDEVIGLEAKREIRPDSTVIATYLAPPIMIKRGESVIMTAKSGSLSVRIPATALKDGYEGEQISVRNKQSKRIVDARVMGPGRVSVTM
jgi:flagella basal body P-ring formation protein FlgA